MTFTIEQLEALKEGTTPGPWKFQPWGAQNQNGDHAESVLMDGSGETIAYALPNSVGETVSRIPALVDALIAEKQAHAELRKRIEERIRELKQPLCSHMPEGDELDDYLEQWGRQSYEVEMLTEILEGNE